MNKSTTSRKVSDYLVLPIKGKWFDMIIAGIKLDEYRDIKPYYEARLRRHVGKGSFNVIFRNGYGRSVPSILCRCFCSIGTGRKEWGAAPDKEYFVLSIISVTALQQRPSHNAKAVSMA